MAVLHETGFDAAAPVTVRNLPIFKQVMGHYGVTPFYLTAEMFGGLGFELAGGEISDKVGQPVAAPHTHTVPEIYLLLAPEPGGAEIDVLLGEENHRLVAPAVQLIPTGTVHHFVTVRAMPGSYCLGILLGVDGIMPEPTSAPRE
jgi:hypothetical protein